MDLSIAIQNHPSRADMAAALAEAVGGEVDIVVDPDPSDRPSAWRTYRRALELTPADADHRLILQDDAEVCPGFRTAATLAAEAQPDRVIVFFVGGQPLAHAWALWNASSAGKNWAELDTLRWCPAIATSWPASLVVPMLEWVDAQKYPAAMTADDEILGRFLRDNQIHPLATVPSLVEHRDVVQSLVGRRNMGGADIGRIAACFIQEGCDASLIDWTAGP